MAHGLHPVVLDGGVRLEPEREAALAAAPDGALDPEFLAAIRKAFPVDVDTLPLKPVYGSTFAYAAGDPSASLRARGFAAVPSLAVGGLSTVWGAAMLPYGERDHEGWPFGRDALEPHYRAVLGFVPLAGERDALAEGFPLYAEPRPLRTTPQVASILADLHSRGDDLRRAGVAGGRSRLAVRLDGNPHGSVCDYRGLCMLGCPRRAIWGSQQTLAELLAKGLVEHRPGTIVERFEEAGDTVRLFVRGPEGRETLVTERAFVASGPLGTARIVLASLEQYDREIALLDSAYYTFPALRLPRGQRVESPLDAGNTLAQVFIEIDDPEVSPRPVHLQLYGFNDLMLRAVAARVRLREPVAARLLQPLLGRLLYVQGYLHSNVSPGARASLGRDGVLSIEGESGDIASAVGSVVAKLRSLRRVLRLEPLSPLLQVWPPGKGFHLGGSFPMRRRPGELETDELGRLPGFRRVHLVDSSVFPTLPATTITLAVMANAHRIASEAVEGSG